MQDMATAAITVDRASFEFRRARPVVITEEGRAVLLAAAAEALATDVLARLRSAGPVRLALTAQRALALKVGTAGTDPVLVPAGTLSAEDLAAIPDPTQDLARPLQGPFTALREAPRPAHKAAVALAKVAQLLVACRPRRGLRPVELDHAPGDLLTRDRRGWGAVTIDRLPHHVDQGHERGHLVGRGHVRRVDEFEDALREPHGVVGHAANGTEEMPQATGAWRAATILTVPGCSIHERDAVSRRASRWRGTLIVTRTDCPAATSTR